MSSRDLSLYIVDIFIAINKIGRYTKKFTNAEDFKWSELEWDATIRELEVIGEATNHLIKYDLLDNDKYRRVVDFRNLIIHGYFGIDENEVWFVVTKKLDVFYVELQQIVKDEDIVLDEALEFAKTENFKNTELLVFLNKLSVLVSR